MFYKYNASTGKKEYVMIDRKPPEPLYHCERCGVKDNTVKITSQGHYHYMCSKCRDECFEWNGDFYEFTKTYSNEWNNIINRLVI